MNNPRKRRPRQNIGKRLGIKEGKARLMEILKNNVRINDRQKRVEDGEKKIKIVKVIKKGTIKWIIVIHGRGKKQTVKTMLSNQRKVTLIKVREVKILLKRGKRKNIMTVKEGTVNVTNDRKDIEREASHQRMLENDENKFDLFINIIYAYEFIQGVNGFVERSLFIVLLNYLIIVSTALLSALCFSRDCSV